MSFKTTTSSKRSMTKIKLKQGLQSSCCAPGCTTDKGANISYSLHPFPSEITEPERHGIWKQLLLIDQKVTRSNVVCARHFPTQSFEQNPDGTSTIFLQPNAYPYATSKLKIRMEQQRVEREKMSSATTKSRGGLSAVTIQNATGDEKATDLAMNHDLDEEFQIVEIL
ncbi:uncharacterized protein LOC134226435 [Armigeres subalbatus]|uniref:uncharacterized protein LOC134226435 n=1 Tax=Armigeres subalbatus TaxID=124917 RepID=UPI002ED4A544